MRIGIIGGLSRANPHYARVALEEGHQLDLHDGKIGGRGAESLEQLVLRCDLVILITDVNSHGAVQLARKRMRETRREPLIVRRCGLSRFAAICREGRDVA